MPSGGKRSSVRAFRSLSVKASGTRGTRGLQGHWGRRPRGLCDKIAVRQTRDAPSTILAGLGRLPNGTRSSSKDPSGAEDWFSPLKQEQKRCHLQAWAEEKSCALSSFSPLPPR